MGKCLTVALIVLVGAGAVCLAPVQTVWDDGLWPLSVAVASASGSPIATVSCEALTSEEDARYSLEHLLPPETRTHSVVADPFPGRAASGSGPDQLQDPRCAAVGHFPI